MVNWTKDRNRQLKKRARAEGISAAIADAAAAPARKSPPRIAKASLRAMGEDLVRQYEEKLRRDEANAPVRKRGLRTRRR